MGADGCTRTALTWCRASPSGSGFVNHIHGGLSVRRSAAPAGGIGLQTAGSGGPKSAGSQRAAGRQMPATRLTRWRSCRSSLRALADLCAHRASATEAAVAARQAAGRGAGWADLQLPPADSRGCGATVAGASPVRRRRARGRWPLQHDGPPLRSSERAAWGHRAAADDAQRQLLRDEQTEPGAVNGDGECSAQPPPFSAL